MKKIKEASKLIGYLFIGIVLIAVYKTLDNFGDIFNWIGKLIGVIMPFIIALILAYALYIPARNVENKINKSKIKIIRNKARPISVVIVYLVLFFIILFIINFVFPVVTNSIKELANNLPSYYGKAVETVSNLPDDSLLVKLNIKEILKSIEQINVTEKLLGFIELDNISQYIKGVMGVASIIFDLFVIIVISIYLWFAFDENKFYYILLTIVLGLFSGILTSMGYYIPVKKKEEEDRLNLFYYIKKGKYYALYIGIENNRKKQLLTGNYN